MDDETVSTIELDSVLAPYHQAALSSKAVSMDVALSAGTRSILSGSDLPPSLAYLKDQVPGILYRHHGVDGEAVWQYRPDNPLDPDKKYIQEAGTGAVITLHPLMRERLLSATTLLVTEGTKQYLAAVGLAITHPELLVVGVQGCRNWSKDGRLVPAFDTLAAAKTKTYLIFDGDFRTNPDVWEGIHLLGENLRLLTGVESLIVDLPVTGKDGLDDYFGARKPGVRQQMFDTALSSAKPLAKIQRTKPRRTRGSKMAPTVDVMEGVIRGRGFEDEPGPILAEFAVRIKSSSKFVDDLNGDKNTSVVHTLEILAGPITDRIEYEVEDVPDAQLRNLQAILEAAGPEGTRLTYDNSEAGLRAIEQAIRAHAPEKAEFFTRYFRTGWAPALADGGFGYLHAGGIIGPDGEEATSAANLDHPYDLIDFPDPARFETDELTAAVKRHLGVISCLVDPSPWFIMIGPMAYSFAGIPPKCVPFSVGGRGSGKSTVAQTAAACLTPAFSEAGGKQMVSADGSGKALGDAGVGLHNGVIIVDDMRTPPTVKAQEEMSQGQEVLIRRGYGGGSAGRDRLTVASSGHRKGRVVRAAADASSPCIILVGEHLPDPIRVPSSVERLISVNVTRESTMKDASSVAEMRQAASSGDLQKAWAGYIQWLAREIKAAGSLGAWQNEIRTRRATIEKTLGERNPELNTPRSREIPAPVIVGWGLFLDFAISVGAVSELEAKRIIQEVWTSTAKAAVNHTVVELGDNGDRPTMVLERIKQGLAAGKFLFEEDTDAAYPSRAPIVAKRVTTREGIACVALNPGILATAIGESQATLKGALSGIALRDQRGGVLRPARFRNATVKSLLIPEAAFSGAGEAKAEAA